MSIKPILFNTDMVRAILDGRKTVTRRVVKPQLEPFGKAYMYNGEICSTKGLNKQSPYQLGDIIYIRETWGNWSYDNPEGNAIYYQYRADYPNGAKKYMFDDKHECDLPKWHPSIHMPKEAARIWLKVTNVRVERLQDMPHDAAGKEGIHYCECPSGFTWKTDTDMNCCYTTPSGAFKALWNSTINKDDINRYGWDADPYAWVIEFERCEKPQEENKNADK